MVVYSKYEAHYILHLVEIVSFYDKMSADSGSFFHFCFSSRQASFSNAELSVVRLSVRQESVGGVNLRNA